MLNLFDESKVGLCLCNACTSILHLLLCLVILLLHVPHHCLHRRCHLHKVALDATITEQAQQPLGKKVQCTCPLHATHVTDSAIQRSSLPPPLYAAYKGASQLANHGFSQLLNQVVETRQQAMITIHHLAELLFGIIVTAWVTAAAANCATVILALQSLAHGATLSCIHIVRNVFCQNLAIHCLTYKLCRLLPFIALQTDGYLAMR